MKLKKSALLIAILMVSTLALAHEEGEENDAKELFENAEMIIVPFVANPDIAIDGKIEAGEYSDYGVFLDEDTGMEVYLEHDGSSLYVGLKNPGNGWVAIGFGNDAEDMEKGANVIMGYIDNGTLFIRDSYASRIDGEMEHEPVENLGGKSDIIAKGIEDSLNTIEFKVALNSEDKYGRHLEPGKIYPIIIAFNDSLKEFSPTLDEGEIHFEKIYVARQSDNLKDISDLFAMNISSTNAVTAAAFLGISFAMLLIAYWRKH